MKSVRVHVDVRKADDVKITYDGPVFVGGATIYFDRNHQMWLCDKEKMAERISSFGQFSASTEVKDSQYLMLFPSEDVMDIGDEEYIPGECLFIGRVGGPSPDDILEAFTEYVMRLEKLSVGDKEMLVLKLDIDE